MADVAITRGYVAGAIGRVAGRRLIEDAMRFCRERDYGRVYGDG